MKNDDDTFKVPSPFVVVESDEAVINIPRFGAFI